MKISIPVPCTEDRTKMASTETGAFCQKCNHEVIDFTRKTPEEIREAISGQSKSRICGFISPVQMELVNTDFHVWENQQTPVFQSKFIYACFLVFGFSLFSACERSETTNQAIEKELGHQQEIVYGMMEPHPDSTCVSPANDTINTGEYSFTNIKLGRIVEEPDPLTDWSFTQQLGKLITE